MKPGKTSQEIFEDEVKSASTPKPIEMPPLTPLALVDWHFEVIYNWMQQVTDAVNKLEE